jgi:hypothetical protein
VTFSCVSRMIRSLSKITLGGTFTLEPRHQMCWTPSPLTLQLWVRGLASFAHISCAKGPRQSSVYTKNSRSIVAQTMTLGCAWKSNLSKRSPLKLTNLARGNGRSQKCLARQPSEHFWPWRRKRLGESQSTGWLPKPGP